MIHCQCRAGRERFLAGYRFFAICYREALKRLREKVGPTFFPKGGIPPGFPDVSSFDSALFPLGGIPPSEAFFAGLT